jgi:CubicO group peptidase (beta-lactamase class C family)
MNSPILLKRERPEKLGVSPAALLNYLKALEQTGFIAHSIMLVKSGKVAFEIHFNPFKPHVKHMLCSCSKSVAATAVGFALAEGLTSLDERIADIFPDKLDAPPHPYIEAMTIRHLLTMTTAYSTALEPVTEDWTREFLNGSPDRYPGTVFAYDSIGTHVLCETVQRRSGKTVQEYLTPRLFEPLGIQGDEILWECNPGGVNHGGGGLHLTPEAMAKFGLLYVNNGIFNRKQILPPGWAEEASAGRVSCVTCDGTYKSRYGYKFWRVQDNGFAALGLAGQAIIMHPDKDVVFVGTANGFQTDYHYFHMTYFWQLVYPAIAGGPIPYEETAYAELMDYVKQAEVFLPGANGLVANDIAGELKTKNENVKKLTGKFLTAEYNNAGCGGFKLTVSETGGELTLQIRKQTVSIPFGYGKHLLGPAAFQEYAKQTGDEYPNGCGSAGFWVDDSTLVIQSHIIDTLQYFLITCHFGEKAVVLEIKPFGIYTYEIFPCAVTHMLSKG